MSGRPNRIHRSARRYARYGWLVLPLHGAHSAKQGASCTCRRSTCGSPAKHPRTEHGLKDATTDLDVIDGWWKRWQAANVGIATGPESGLLVVDIDGVAGRATIEQLQRNHGSLSDHLWQRTGSGGWHCILRYPDGVELGNTARRLGPGVDTRGAGGYIVAPPSRHASGAEYRWLQRRDPAPAPDWLVDLLKPPPPGLPPAPMDTSSARFGRTIDGLVHTAAQAQHGNRNAALYWSARRLGQHVAAGNLTEDDVYVLLLPAAAASGLAADDGERSCVATIRSGVARGQQDGAPQAVAS